MVASVGPSQRQPRVVNALRLMNSEINARHTLAAIRVPTLVLHRVGDEDIVLAEGRSMVERIRGAEMVELPGVDHGWWVDSGQIVREVEPFLQGIWRQASGRGRPTGSWRPSCSRTSPARRRSWPSWATVAGRKVLQQHHELVRRQLLRFSGREIDTAWDGFFASFDGPVERSRVCVSPQTSGVCGWNRSYKLLIT